MKRLYRSNTDIKLGGVIGGLAEYLDADPSLLRLITVLVAFFSGIFPVVITYFIAWAIVPIEPIEGESVNADTSRSEKQQTA